MKKNLIFGDNLANEVTEEFFFKRRNLIKLGLFAPGLAIGNSSPSNQNGNFLETLNFKKTEHDLSPTTEFKDATTYNNFYEFGTRKSDPSKYAPKLLRTKPWAVDIEGLVSKPMRFDIEDLIKFSPLEERVYRLRCVEGWSMVIPWIGYSFKNILKIVQPLGSAKFVEFVSLADPKMMPGVGGFRPVLNWPYREALRLDEAFHPLTLLTFGAYGKTLLPQNGSPVRIIVPWKYGFKSPKSLVKIRFVEKMPITTWVQSSPHEYGFYSNVNPNVNHKRWSQASERKIGGGFFSKRQKTMIFNGYADSVASLYAGMDLKKFF